MLEWMVAAAMTGGSLDPDCDGTTLEIVECIGVGIDAAEARMKRYFDAAIERLEGGEDPAQDGRRAAIHLRYAQTMFEAMRQAECRADYEQYGSGTMRSIAASSCHLQMVNDRTHAIWRRWLHYADSTPPMLPEPEPIEAR